MCIHEQCVRAHVYMRACACWRGGGGGGRSRWYFPHLSVQPSCSTFHGQMRLIIGPKASQAQPKMSTAPGDENGANAIPSKWKQCKLMAQHGDWHVVGIR